MYIGSKCVELLTERRHFRVNIPQSVNNIHDALYDQVADVIEHSSLLRDQKDALLMIAHNMGLPDEDLFSLAKAEMVCVDESHQRSAKRTDLVTKIGPMMGLICTLIPLGPGIVAMVISTIRKRWCSQYFVAMEALMNTLLEKAEQARRAGIELPHGYTGPARAGLPDNAASKKPSSSSHGR